MAVEAPGLKDPYMFTGWGKFIAIICCIVGYAMLNDSDGEQYGQGGFWFGSYIGGAWFFIMMFVPWAFCVSHQEDPEED